MVGHSAYQTVVKELRRDIVQGILSPDQKLVEQKLAKRYHTSRTPLREAIRQLQAEGLVKSTPNRGTRVARLSINDFYELFEIRELLERHACQKIAHYITAEGIQRLKTLVQQIRTNQAAPHLNDNYDLVARYYTSMIFYCRNSLLQQIIASIVQKCAPFRFLMVASRGVDQLYACLARIPTLLENRDDKGFAEEMSKALTIYKKIIFEEILATHPKLIQHRPIE